MKRMLLIVSVLLVIVNMSAQVYLTSETGYAKGTFSTNTAYRSTSVMLQNEVLKVGTSTSTEPIRPSGFYGMSAVSRGISGSADEVLNNGTAPVIHRAVGPPSNSGNYVGPVGDGLWIVLLLAIGYLILRVLKRHSYNMKKLFITLFIGLMSVCAFAQTTYLLSSQGSNYITDKEYTSNNGQIYNITAPRLDVYLPASKASGASCPMLLVCPGGAYEYVSALNEGKHVAEWMNARGIAVAVLDYRLPNGHEEIPLSDARAALRFVRENAVKWGVSLDSIGVMGFSAGGHLAASLLCYSEADCKANFGVLIYPVLSMEDGVTHAKTKRLLLGENPTAEQVTHWTLKNAVSTAVPPTLLVACQDDKAVPVRNSLEFYQALTDQKVPAELLILPNGGHGWGFTRTFPNRDLMEETLLRWIRR